jgi:hypothetical protein
MHYSTDANGFENDIPSDALDALADLAYEQHQAMMEEYNDPIQDLIFDRTDGIQPIDYYFSMNSNYNLHHELNNKPTV